MEKHLGWVSKLGGAEPLGISKVGCTVLARLMESQIQHQPTRSVGGALIKGTVVSAHLDARPFSLSLYITGALQTPVREPRGSESE